MRTYVTIQKFSETTGVSESKINSMIKQGVINTYEMKGLRRLFINPTEFFSKLQPRESTYCLERFEL